MMHSMCRSRRSNNWNSHYWSRNTHRGPFTFRIETSFFRTSCYLTFRVFLGQTSCPISVTTGLIQLFLEESFILFSASTSSTHCEYDNCTHHESYEEDGQSTTCSHSTNI